MAQRVIIAISLACDPEIVISDGKSERLSPALLPQTLKLIPQDAQGVHGSIGPTETTMGNC